MAFKLRSPLHKENPKFGEVPVASGDKSFGGYQSKLKSQMMSTKNPDDSGVGTYPDPQTGKRTYYDKKHQSYDRKTGVVNKTGSFKDGKYELNKPKPKAKSILPASQGGSPFNSIGQAAAQRDKSNAQEGKGTYKFENNNKSKTSLRMPRFSVSKYMEAAPGTKFAAAISSDENTLKTSGPKELRPGGGVRRSTLTNEGYKIPGTSDNKRPEYKIPGTGSSTVKPKNTTKPKSSTSTKKAAKPISSSDSGDRSGGYLKDTKNFSLGVDTKLSTGSMPKLEKTVTNARSADYDMIKAKGRGKIDRLKTRLAKREGRVSNRVEASSMRIKSRQKRSGERYASKMEARTNTGTDPGYFESQKKLDAFEKSMGSPKATSRTSKAGNITGAGKIGDSKSMPSLRTPKSNQKPDGARIKLNTSTQTSITIDDSKIKKGVKQAKDGRINEKVSESTYKNAKGLNKLTKKAGPSGGMERGMPKSSTSITKPGSGPRAKTVKVKSGPSKREKAIMNTYNNIRK